MRLSNQQIVSYDEYGQKLDTLVLAVDDDGRLFGLTPDQAANVRAGKHYLHPDQETLKEEELVNG